MGLWSQIWALFASPRPLATTPPRPTAQPARHSARSEQARSPAAATEKPAAPPASSAPSDQALDSELQTELAERCESLLRDELADEPDLRYVVETLGGELTDALPQIPQAAQQGLALTVDSTVQVDELIHLFEHDPSLAQALLKTANSSYYSAVSPCTSISAAVVKLGRRGLRNVLLMQLMRGLVCRPGQAFGSMPSDVWTHMSETAPLARSLALPLGANSDEAFALGLLHDAGKIVFFEAASVARRTRRREIQVADPATISACLAVLHEPLGGLAVAQWGFGTETAQIVAHHHRKPPPEGANAISEAVYLADRVQLAGDLSSISLEALWAEGSLSGSPARVAELPTDTWIRRSEVLRTS